MTKLQRNNTGHRGGFSVLFTKADLKYCNRCKKELKLIEERVGRENGADNRKGSLFQN